MTSSCKRPRSLLELKVCNFDTIWSNLSCKRPARLDILGGRLREVQLYNKGKETRGPVHRRHLRITHYKAKINNIDYILLIPVSKVTNKRN